MRMSLNDMRAELIHHTGVRANRVSVKSNLEQHVHLLTDADEHQEIVNRIAEFEKEIVYCNSRISRLSADIRVQEEAQ